MNALHTLLLLAVLPVPLLALAGGARGRRLAWHWGRFVVLGCAAAVVLAPFAWLLCAAFKDPAVLMEHTFLPPVGEWSAETLNLRNFRELWSGDDGLEGHVPFWRYIANSIFLASVSTCLGVLFCSMGGYALAKYRFPGRRVLLLYMLGTMMFPGVLLLAPLFQLIHRIGWMDSYLALLVPGAASVFGMFLFRQAMVGVPDSLLEAARIDGAGEFSIYLRVVMPLVRPMTGAFCLVHFLGSWNAFIGPQVFLQTQALLTLPVVLNQYVGIYSQQYGVFLAGTLLAMIPPALLFFALQREFVSGLTSGAVKG